MIRRQFLKMIALLSQGVVATRAFAAPQVQPRHVICVLGNEGWLPIASKQVAAFGQGFTIDRDYSLEKPDDRMAHAFDVALDRVAPTFTGTDRKSVLSHKTVAYVLSPPLTPTSSRSVSARALNLTALLLANGGLAAKSESAGLAHGRYRWLSLSQAAGDSSKRNDVLYEAWVRRPLRDEKVVYSCGMHLLGQPDVECVGSLEDRQFVTLMDKAAKELLDGRPVKLTRTKCLRYPDDDFFFNPYGYVRIEGT